jgi:hypothetical protein
MALAHLVKMEARSTFLMMTFLTMPREYLQKPGATALW